MRRDGQVRNEKVAFSYFSVNFFDRQPFYSAISSNILDVVVNFLEEVLDKSFGCEAVVDVLDKSGGTKKIFQTYFFCSKLL